MPTYRIQVALQDVSNLPRDQYVNSWHVARSATFDDGDWGATVTAFEDFYNSWITPYGSTAIVPGALHTIKGYLIGGALHDPPERSGHISVVGGSLAYQAMPGEVAMCLTMHGDPQPLPVQPQSWRGRIYLGPLGSAAMGTITPGPGRPDADFIASLLDAAEALRADLGVAANQLVILSKKQNKAYPVATVGADDAWDTQRSRGLRPSYMSKRTIVGGGGPGVTP